MYHNSKLSKFAFRTKTGLKWPFFAQTIPFFVLCFITNIYIWYIVGSGISRSERLQYFQIHKRYVTFLIMLFVYFSCQGRSFMLTARWDLTRMSTVRILLHKYIRSTWIFLTSKRLQIWIHLIGEGFILLTRGFEFIGGLTALLTR